MSLANAEALWSMDYLIAIHYFLSPYFISHHDPQLLHKPSLKTAEILRYTFFLNLKEIKYKPQISTEEAE